MNYIYKKLRLDEEETLKFMKQIVSAIDHLHRAGIIHRCVCMYGWGVLAVLVWWLLGHEIQVDINICNVFVVLAGGKSVHVDL